jgi:hypothetical protein
MDDRELDVLVATFVMGWAVLTPAETETMTDVSDQVCVLHPRPFGLMRYHEARPQYFELRPWHPSEDIVAAYNMEAAIKERGLASRYIRALIKTTGLSETRFDLGRFDEDDLFTLLRATPEQRCRAALATVGVTIP